LIRNEQVSGLKRAVTPCAVFVGRGSGARARVLAQVPTPSSSRSSVPHRVADPAHEVGGASGAARSSRCSSRATRSASAGAWSLPRVAQARARTRSRSRVISSPVIVGEAAPAAPIPRACSARCRPGLSASTAPCSRQERLDQQARLAGAAAAEARASESGGRAARGDLVGVAREGFHASARVRGSTRARLADRLEQLPSRWSRRRSGTAASTARRPVRPLRPPANESRRARPWCSSIHA